MNLHHFGLFSFAQPVRYLMHRIWQVFRVNSENENVDDNGKSLLKITSMIFIKTEGTEVDIALSKTPNG